MKLRAAAGDPAVRLSLYVPYAGHPPSVNVATRMHGAAHSAAMEGWRDNATTVARAAARSLHLALPLPPSIIRVTCPMPTATIRDPHNYTGTLVKSIIDGLVRARFWTDDSTGHVTVVDTRFVHIPELKDPRTQARATALVHIVPVAALLAALDRRPELAQLFETDTP